MATGEVVTDTVDQLIREMLTSVSVSLTDNDRTLISHAKTTIELKFAHGFHQLASVAVGQSGKLHIGLQHDAKVGQASGCAEFFALHFAEMAEDPLVTIVTVRHAPDKEGGQVHLVTPCGMCRERLLQFSPDVMVIIPFGEEVIKVPVRALLPVAYALRNRPNGNRGNH